MRPPDRASHSRTLRKYPAEGYLRKHVPYLRRGRSPVAPVPAGRPVEHPEQRQCGERRVQVWLHHAGLDAFPQEGRPSLLVPPPKLAGFLELFVWELQWLRERNREAGKAIVNDLQVGDDGTPNADIDRTALCEHLVEPGVRRPKRADDNLVEEFLLAPNVVVEATLQDAKLVGDVLDGCRSVAAAPEYACRGVEDLLPFAGAARATLKLGTNIGHGSVVSLAHRRPLDGRRGGGEGAKHLV